MVTYKQASGSRRTAVASGVAVGVAGLAAATAASLGLVGTASASCVNISGIAIGGGGPTGHCQASFGSFAIVIGPTPTDEDGSDAFAGNPELFSPFNFAISVGGTAEQPTFTSAGRGGVEGLPSIGNVSFATAGSTANSAGVANLAASLGGTRSSLLSAGVGNSTLNLGSDNELVSAGVVNNSTVLFGNENVVSASNAGEGLNRFLTGFNVAFSTGGDGNTVVSGASVPPPLGGPGNGPLSIAGAILVSDQTGADTVRNTNTGIELRTPLDVPAATSVLAAGNKVAPKTFAAGSVNRSGSKVSGSLTKASTQVSSSLSSLKEKVAGAVSKVTKAGASSKGDASDS